MTKANIETNDGTKIVIEGSEEEILRILRSLSNEKVYTNKNNKTNNRLKKQKSKLGLTDNIRELKEEGFFDQQKTIVEIKNELARRALIYPITSIQPTLLRLIKKRELGRLKADSKWVYVRR